ncbi:hypothetical protein AMR72_01000 [Flavobacterium psychrophilum]|nr:hypothetical protein AMR72_01000 [Flavobacterium psychrophilum]AOE51224.1 hypothetical protein ALW18_01000 [Flavobacterium psychrophilum]
MKFVHRLAYYLFGFLIGGLFLLFVFKNKKTEFCYMPNCRVLKDIRSKGITVSKEAQATLNEKWVTMDDIQNTLKNGDVDFSKSNKINPGGGKIYIIEGRTLKNQPIVLEIVNKSERAILKDVKK